jgi:hypothetical protein
VQFLQIPVGYDPFEEIHNMHLLSLIQAFKHSSIQAFKDSNAKDKMQK